MMGNLEILLRGRKIHIYLLMHTDRHLCLPVRGIWLKKDPPICIPMEEELMEKRMHGGFMTTVQKGRYILINGIWSFKIWKRRDIPLMEILKEMQPWKVLFMDYLLVRI